jgi:hypothetical protein
MYHLLLVGLAMGVSPQSFSESLIRFDSALRAYSAATNGPTDFIYTFPDASVFSNEQPMRVWSKSTLAALKERIDTTTRALVDTVCTARGGVRLTPVDRMHVVASIVSVLADPITTICESKLVKALETLSSLEAGGYTGLYFRCQDDSSDEEEVCSSPKQVRNLPWMRIIENLNTARDYEDAHLARLIHISVKAAFGSIPVANNLAEMTDLIASGIRENRPTEFLYSQIDWDLLQSVSVWTDHAYETVLAVQSMIHRIEILSQFADFISVLYSEVMPSISFPRSVLGVPSAAFQTNLFLLPTDFLESYLRIQSLIEQGVAIHEWVVPWLALNVIIEKKLKSFDIMERLERVFEEAISVPARLIAGSLRSFPSSIVVDDYKAAILNIAVCQEIGDSANLNQALASLMLFEEDLGHEKIYSHGIIPALSAVDEFMASL